MEPAKIVRMKSGGIENEDLGQEFDGQAKTGSEDISVGDEGAHGVS